MKTKFLILAFLTCTAFISCKKDEAAPQSAKATVQGKWYLQTLVQNDHYAGADHISTYPSNSSDYYDFRDDGKVYAYILGNYDVTTYGIIDATHLWIDVSTDIYEIKNLTATTMQLYQKTPMNAADYYESTLNLKK